MKVVFFVVVIGFGMSSLLSASQVTSQSVVTHSSVGLNRGLLDTLTWRTLPTSYGSYSFSQGCSVAIWFRPLTTCSLKAIRIHFKTFDGNIIIDVFRARYNGHITTTDSTNAFGWVGTYQDGKWVPGWVLGYPPLGCHLWGPFPLTVTNENDYSWVEVSAALLGEKDLSGDPFFVVLNTHQLSGGGINGEDERTVPYHCFIYSDNCCGPDGVHNGWFLWNFSLWVEVIVNYYGNVPPEITNMDVLNDTYSTGPFSLTAQIVDTDISTPEQAGVAAAFLHWNISGVTDSIAMVDPLEDDLYTAQLPAITVGDRVEYYVSAVDSAGVRSFNTARAFSRITPDHPEADILLIDYGFGVGLSEYWPAVIDSLGYVLEYWNAQEHQGIDGSIVGYGWSTVIPWGMYRVNVPILPTRECEGHLWADFMLSGTAERPAHLLFAAEDYFGLNRESQNPVFETGDFAYDFFGLDSAATEYGIGGEKTLYGAAGDPVSGDFTDVPFRHTWPLDWFHQYWFKYTSANERSADLFYTLDGKSTGVRCDGGSFKTVFLPWEIEYMLEKSENDTVPSADFRRLVENILHWFGTKKQTRVEEPQAGVIPRHFVLEQNYPNPFNPTTRINFQIPNPKSKTPVHTTLKIYNILGQEVRKLVDDVLEPGYYTTTWDGKDCRGRDMASGVYFYRLPVNHGQWLETKRMVLLR